MGDLYLFFREHRTTLEELLLPLLGLYGTTTATSHRHAMGAGATFGRAVYREHNASRRKSAYSVPPSKSWYLHEASECSSSGVILDRFRKSVGSAKPELGWAAQLTRWLQTGRLQEPFLNISCKPSLMT